MNFLENFLIKSIVYSNRSTLTVEEYFSSLCVIHYLFLLVNSCCILALVQKTVQEGAA